MIIWGDNKVRIVLDRNAYFNNNSTRSLKQQPTDKQVSPLVHIIINHTLLLLLIM